MKYLLLFLSLLLFSGCETSGDSNPRKQETLQESISSITRQIKSKLNQRGMRLAVLPILDEKGDRTLLGDNISNQLQISLFDTSSYTLVERERVDSLLYEYDFTEGGLVDKSDMAEIGRLLSVDTVVLGTMRDELEAISIYIRIVNIETGAILAVGQSLLSKNPNTESQFSTITDFSKKSTQGSYSLLIKEINFYETISLDAFSSPDIYFTLIVDNIEKFKSPTFKTFPKVLANQTADLYLMDGSNITIRIWEDDVFQDDLIDDFEISKELILRYLRGEVINLTSDKVTSMSIVLKKKM